MRAERIEGEKFKVEEGVVVDGEGREVINLYECESVDLKLVEAGGRRGELVFYLGLLGASFLLVDGVFLFLEERYVWGILSGILSVIVLSVGLSWRRWGKVVYGIFYVRDRKFWLESEDELKRVKRILLYIKERERKKKIEKGGKNDGCKEGGKKKGWFLGRFFK